MDPITQQTALASAGGKKDPLYVDDVFSTTLYEGKSTLSGNVVVDVQTGIDNVNETTLVWIKNRDASVSHKLGILSGNQLLESDNATGQSSNLQISALTDGVRLPSYSAYGNRNGENFVCWNFKAAPGFLDIVTYTGNESNPRQIAHNLGSVPGMIIVKSLSTGNWLVYHRSLNNGSNPGNYRLRLDEANATESGTSTFGATATSTHFTISTNCNYANNYVAYIFAHDEAVFGTDEDKSIIKCGTYIGGGSTSVEVNLGFEPQWVLIKSADTAYSWWIVDSMRGISPGDDASIKPNNNGAESNPNLLDLTATGFKTGTNANANKQGDNFIYMAIRRPHKPPTAATEVFNTVQNNTTLISGTKVDFGFTPDMHIASRVTSSSSRMISSRLMGGRYSFTDNTSAEGASLSSYNKEQTTVEYTGQASNDSGTYLHYGFKRTPGFFDVITYTGASSYPITRYHSLGVAPEMIWLKLLDHTTNPWTVYHSLYGSNSRLRINEISAVHTDNQLSDWYLTTPTDSYFKVGTHGGYTNLNGKLHIAYLWATLPGISKVGSYTGTGNDINVDCGFTSGARFVLIRLASGVGNWYLYDSVRGIGSGNDPFLKLNSAASQTTNSDYIDIDASSTGFKINSGSSYLNISGGNYIFLAIA